MLSKQMNNANKKLAISKLIPLLNDLARSSSTFPFCVVLVHYFVKTCFSYSLTFSNIVLHEQALDHRIFSNSF